MISPARFQRALLAWEALHHRDFPWIGERDPYKIWISEIMLQQTRSEQAEGYYHRFLKKYPTLKKLAQSEESDVINLWKGLGYYSRARNLRKTALLIQEQFSGSFPEEVSLLKKLPGIGDYTASAIAAFAFQKPAPVMDGNVIRLYSRLLGIPFLPVRAEEKKYWKETIHKYFLPLDPAAFNQAIMNFGAVHCKPVNPLCDQCPFEKNCIAYQQEQVHRFPPKKTKGKIRDRHFHYILMENEIGQIAIRPRLQKDIWHKLFELPKLETESTKRIKKITYKELFPDVDLPAKEIQLTYLQSDLALLSHQKIHCHFYSCSGSCFPYKIKQAISFVNRENLSNFAFPSVLLRFFSRFNLSAYVK